MNYIQQLRTALMDAEGRLTLGSGQLRAFREHLALPKFQGVSHDGSRKDWIAVEDVRRWLDTVEQQFNHGDVHAVLVRHSGYCTLRLHSPLHGDVFASNPAPDAAAEEQAIKALTAYAQTLGATSTEILHDA